MKNERVYLLDANVLIALLTPEHVSHQRARTWFGSGVMFATCPITQGALLRFVMRWSERPVIAEAKSILKTVCALATHRFWADDLDYAHLPEKGVRGHRQITGAYLAALAAAHDGLLATMDEGMAALHPSAVLI